MGRIAGALSRGLGNGKRAQAAFALALDFHAWRRLAQSGLDPAEAAELMADAVLGTVPAGDRLQKAAASSA
jgi:hypothetical protein